jgi:transcriptional regulator with XRE-family HTH domain
MFKENFIRLCNQKGESPSSVCRAVGIAPATFSCWTEESVPRKATLMRIADYLGVTVDDLLKEEKAPPAEADEADELTELLQELKTRPEMKMLFSLAKGATKEDVELAVQIIERMRRQGGDGE